MLLVKALMMSVALIAVIIGQVVAGVELGVVESNIFAGISLAAIAFKAHQLRSIAE